jgi:nucleotide-binding universal stress UspA family protein
MSDTHTPPRGSVVVGVEGHDKDEQPLRAAVAEARRHHRPLHLLHATAIGIVPWTVERLDRQRALTAGAVERAVALAPDLSITSSTVVADQSAALIDASAVAALVVVGTGSLGHVGAVVLGATTGKVVAHSSCPVMAVPQHDEGRAAGGPPDALPVVVGVDDEEHSSAAVEWAFAEAAARRAPLTAVHAWWWDEPGPLAIATAPDDPEEWADDWASAAQAQRVMMSEMLAGWREKYPEVEVDVQFVRGESTAVLQELSGDAGVLVLGTRGRGGFTGLLLGSVSARALYHSRCPVVVVPSHPRRPGSA